MVYEARKVSTPLRRERKKRSSVRVRASSAASSKPPLELLLAQEVQVRVRLLPASQKVSEPCYEAI